MHTKTAHVLEAVMKVLNVNFSPLEIIKLSHQYCHTKSYTLKIYQSYGANRLTHSA